MKKGILITLPRSDDVTEYLSIFSKPILELSIKKSVRIKSLKGEEVNKVNFETILKKLDYSMLVFNGHGSPNFICGHKNEKLIELGKNENLLTGRITYARSCWAVVGLGRTLVDKKGCFIGYKIPFMFLMDSTWATNPIKDNIAKIFFDTSNKVPLALIKGHTTFEAHENSRKSMLKAIKKALRNKDKDSEAIAGILWNNYFGQEIIGDYEAKL